MKGRRASLSRLRLLQTKAFKLSHSLPEFASRLTLHARCTIGPGFLKHPEDAGDFSAVSPVECFPLNCPVSACLLYSACSTGVSSGEHGRHPLSRFSVEKNSSGDGGGGSRIGFAERGSWRKRCRPGNPRADVRPRSGGAQRDHVASIPTGKVLSFIHACPLQTFQG